MAIQKNIKQTSVSQPQALCKFPDPTCGDCSGEFKHHHCPEHCKPHICNNFLDAVAECSNKKLKPGETYTAYYATEESGKLTYHCVIAVGNANVDAPHLYLTDSGCDYPLSDFVNKVNSIIVSINSINSNIEKLDSRITELEQIDPISDASIISLFHSPIEDAYTVNLCCYTEAGYINIEDDYNEYKNRVADCTPANEYKTYNNGEHVSFTAIANNGYKFVKWLEDANDYSTNSSIKLAFNNKRGDINVIGTLNNGVTGDSNERAPLKNGYTALFEKLLTLKAEVSMSGEKSDFPQSEQFDTLVVKVNGIIKKTPVYVEKGDTIEINAIAVEHHKFLYFEQNGEKIESETGVYSFTIKEDTTITAHFLEIQYIIHGEPNIAQYGNVNITPHMDAVIEGTTVKLEAVPSDGHTFTKWVLDDSDPWYTDDEHKDWSSTDNPILIVAGDVKKDWDINAVFE